ncbi:hypothetical protein KJ359_011411 [Pestalotiopsis sp. 9143b]|nr:hypothetical protein KJ359_011411 [Pestalotiopsis sp. 9143b]
MRGASRADMDRAGRGPGTYAPSSSSNAGLGSTGPRSYDHRLEPGYGHSRAYVPPSTSFSAPRLNAHEEEMIERYWNAEPAPSGRIVDVSREPGAHPHLYAGPNGVPAGSQSSRFREHLEGPSGSGYTTPRRPVPGHAVSGYEPHVRQQEPETSSPDAHWPATEGPGLVRRQAIRRPQPSEGMRRREELHRLREESRRRRSSDRGAMPEGTGNGPSPRERSRPRPMKRVRFATEVERFSRGW